jgi:hypothetical protein
VKSCRQLACNVSRRKKIDLITLSVEEPATCTGLWYAGCDASALIEKEPAMYLLSSADVLQRMQDSFHELKRRLVGADVAAMLHEQPRLLSLNVSRGMDDMLQLWDIDNGILRESDPGELALALRTLSEIE